MFACQSQFLVEKNLCAYTEYVYILVLYIWDLKSSIGSTGDFMELNFVIPECIPPHTSFCAVNIIGHPFC